MKKREIVPVEASQLLPKVKELKSQGYRFLQACATKMDDGIEVMYSFDLDHDLLSLRMNIADDEEIQSISGDYWSAFIYENEMHDLFGIKVANNVLDYNGNFFITAMETPWNPKNEE